MPKWYLLASNTTERSGWLWTAAGLYLSPSEKNGYHPAARLLPQYSSSFLVGNPGAKETSLGTCWAVSAVAPGLSGWKLVQVHLTHSHDVSAGVPYGVRKQCSPLLVAQANSDPLFSSRLLPRASLCTAPHFQVYNGKWIFLFQAVALIMGNLTVSEGNLPRNLPGRACKCSWPRSNKAQFCLSL